MPTPQPLREDISLSNQVVELTAQRHPNELEVRRCEAAVQRLMERPHPDIDLASCYVSLGMLRIVRADGRGALEAVRNARRLRPADQGTVANLLMALLNLGDIRESCDLADEWRIAAKGHPDLLASIYAAYRDAHRAEDALQVWREMGSLQLGQRLVDGYTEEELMSRSIELQKEETYTCRELQERFCFAMDVLRKEGHVYPLRHSHLTVSDGSSMHRLFVDASLDRCYEVGLLVMDRLVDQFDRTGSEVMSLRCLPVDAYFDMFERCGPAEASR